MELSTLAIALLSIALTYYFLISPKRRSGGKLPPGPRPLPVVGNIFQLGTKPHQSLAQLAKTHGPLMSLHFGSVYTVIVTSPEMAREIFVKHDQDFLNRTVVEAVHAHDHDSISMAFMDVGAEWRTLRRICKEQIFSVKSLETSQVCTDYLIYFCIVTCYKYVWSILFIITNEEIKFYYSELHIWYLIFHFRT